jgi:hypothetical protein
MPDESEKPGFFPRLQPRLSVSSVQLPLPKPGFLIAQHRLWRSLLEFFRL